MIENYVCQVCGHPHDPAEGDPDAWISPGTAFTSLTDTRHCAVKWIPKRKIYHTVNGK